MTARLVQLALMCAAAGLSYWGWTQLNTLRGTPFFEYRYLIVLCGAILMFSVAQAVAGWIDGRMNPEEDH